MSQPFLRSAVVLTLAGAAITLVTAASTDAGAAEATSCKMGDFADCTAKCTKNDFDACATLGWMHVIAKGAPKDPAKALTFLQKACTGKSGRGCVDLAYLYEYGIGVPKDEAKALADYTSACNDKNLY